MDKEQEEIQFLGFFGILKESLQIVFSWKKIFTQIAVSLILPLSFVYLLHILMSDYLFSDILRNGYILDHTRMGTTSYNYYSEIVYSDWTKVFLFKFAYLVLFLILSLLSTSAVVYTIACIYTAREVSFKNSMSVVPKVWKRLMATFLWNIVIVFAYHMAAVIILLFLVIVAILFNMRLVPAVIIFSIFSIIYIGGLFYISLIWHLASVVSVLEDIYGLKAMVKSQELIKGKMGVSAALMLLLGLCIFGNQMLFERFVVPRGRSSADRMGYVALCLVVQSVLMLLGLITQTIIYFVCKSFHHESIDKSSLSDHLEVYLGEYVPLKSKDVQLEQFQV